MGLIYKDIFKPLLFRQDPERAHEMAVFLLKLLGQVRPLTQLMTWYNKVNAAPIKLWGLDFPNFVGLAAGFDKNGECWQAASAIGFGHVEIGTVTLHRQSGNPKPRLYRFPEENALINAMGFNNDGVHSLVEHLSSGSARRERAIPLGINIGKSKLTPLNEAIEEYIMSFNLLADYADYITINISSPNTAGLRKLQSKDYLGDLLGALKKANADRARKMGCCQVPVLVKITSDLSYREVDDVLEVIEANQISGLITTNTTVNRPGSLSKVECKGGLSGAPLHKFSVDMINYVYKATSGRLPIIGVGGIMSPDMAGMTMDAGASLIQVYTGLVYEGPFFARDIAKSLVWRQRSWI